MLNTKYKKLCLVKCVNDGLGITVGKEYKVYSSLPHSIMIANDHDIIRWYNKNYFERVK